jgi:hypothetical protein
VDSSARIGNWSEFDKNTDYRFEKLQKVQKHFIAATQDYTIQAFHGKTLSANFCTDLEMI